ncbi:Tfp pilus assembly protein PilF [Xenococcus sp. PCC 7305]|uniref:tetratricopeptide repeat protein n=1 Tax=Xenococcus sp. PCC 7305 TaxID=102125 RepID=UPI0002ABDE45|nr:tetratricopeptide repeat protein [Xenococcus sp. PCC 7305]ELS03524.1 Tfp pilus assembly protein PilF [Xenococcus sp. PCC 7305]
MSAEDKSRDIDISKGDYNEYIQGHYINGDFIQIINLPQPKLGFPQNIPRSNTDKFVGRKNELILLHEQLQNEGNVTIAHLEGMGGIGKTEMAIVYSLISLKDDIYPGGICWLRCREENIGLKIVDFARTKLNLEPPEDLELPGKVDWCWTNWREGNTLIVLDDVTDYDGIKSYLPPQSSQFKILITTRLKLELANPLYLEALSETEALELLSELVGSEKVNQELATAQELCQRLGYLPLALQLVGRYVKRRRISLSEELRRLEGKGLAHPSMKIPEKKSTWAVDIERGVAAAFELSWRELDEPAQELGCLLSLFSLAPIPWSLVESSAEVQDPEELEDIRLELENLHLLQAGDNYQLHQLIQEFFRDKQKRLANTEEQKANLCTAVARVAREIPQALTLDDVTYFTPFIPHISETATFYQNSLRDEDFIFSFANLGRFYQGQGAYEPALVWRKQSLSVAKERFGEFHLGVALSLNNLASLYDEQGIYEGAEALYLQALEIHKKLLGESSAEVALGLNNLAHVYCRRGKYTEAEPFYLQSLELKKNLLGELHIEVALGLNNLAELYRSQGKYKEAEPLYLQALESYQKLLGESHPNVATSLNNLALLYHTQGRYEEAEPLFLRALKLRKKLLGESHPDVALSLNSLASLYHAQGRYEEAEPLYLQSLQLNKKLLGESHPNIASILNNLAFIYRNQGKDNEAKPLYLQSLELRKKLLGESHPDIAASLNNLASLCHDQGRYAEAETFYLQALKIKKELLGESNPAIATSLNNLASLYDDQERYTKAKPLYQQALKIAEAALGENHPNTNIIRQSLQYTLAKMQS